MELEELYSNYSSGMGNIHEVLDQTHWFSSISDFDLLTREALPQMLSSVLRKITNNQPSSVLKDRLWRIIEHAREPLDNLLRNLNESPQRDHAVLPFYAARELDTPSFMALARRPGRSIREKLAGKPYLQAVRRFQSVDLPENRLLKAFSERLAELLELRVESLQDDEAEELLTQIRLWLMTDEAESISRWENLPPNNTLLSHRDYRRIWDSWNWLQTLEENIENDLNNLKERRNIVQTWQAWGEMYAESRFRIAETPVLFDYDNFKIRLWTDMPHFQKTEPFSRPKKLPAINEPVCIDLTELYPRYAYLTSNGATSVKTHPNSFIWQSWTNPDLSSQPDNFELFNSDAVYLHSDATTISIPELFFNHNHTPDHLKKAARSFSVKLQESFKNKVFIWLQPDYLNDFELKIIRSNINSCFPDAEPLPRSVAAVFEKIDYNEVYDGYKVVVQDSIGGKLCATMLEAKYDKALEERLDDTCGFYWERYPSVVLPDSNSEVDENNSYNIITLDMNNNWHEAQEPKNPDFWGEDLLRQNSQIGDFNCPPINISDSPVWGGVHYYELQKNAGDIPLWRDQIPELAIKAWNKGIYRRFDLVPRNIPSIPIRRGKPIHLPVTYFTLPAKKNYYQFPLFMGQNEDEIGYSAKLESPDLPLQEDLECKLHMTFTYGADDPYRLVFLPVNNKSIQPIRVKWEKVDEKVVTNSPAPQYPKPMTWEELRSFPKEDSDEIDDLLDWALSAFEKLDQMLYNERVTGRIINGWIPDRKGYYHHAFVQHNSITKPVFIHECDIIQPYKFSDFRIGDEISFELKIKNDKITGKKHYSGKNIAPPQFKRSKQLNDIDEELNKSIVSHIYSALHLPIILIWRDGRSIYDGKCPIEFKEAMELNIKHLSELLHLDIPNNIRYEILLLLSYMHTDAPDECIQWITNQVENQRISNARAIGFALGSLSELWQKYIFNELIQQPDEDVLRVIGYAIWREKSIIKQFSLSECQTILDGLKSMLTNITSYPLSIESEDESTICSMVRSTAEPLELLLGMLRTRNSFNNKIKMLLQPNEKITKELSNQVERLIEIIVESDVPLFSRVQIDNLPEKVQDDRTPDLLYALRLYLTGGDNGADAIRITGVSDKDD